MSGTTCSRRRNAAPWPGWARPRPSTSRPRQRPWPPSRSRRWRVLRGGEYVIANPIYKEVIPRVLSFDQQAQLYLKPAWYLRPDGRLDMVKLMREWQKFWRQDGHLAAEGFAYREAGPHLMLM